MKSIQVGVLVWIVYGLMILRFANSYDQETVVFTNTYGSEQLVESKSESVISYDRIDEVKKKCAFVLNSASDFEPEDDRNSNIREELFFVNGDWEQDVREAPIMPFDNREVSNNSYDLRTPLNLVSFWVTDIDRTHHSKKSIAVNALLSMGITIDGSFVNKPYEGGRQFEIWRSHTELSISFQGIYTETNGAERVMCLLGSTMLPAREPGSPNPWQWVNDTGYNYNQPPLLQDDQILLVLHYPMTVTLTNRQIRGELKSLNSKSNLKYFDEVHISSQMVRSKYEFDSTKIVSRACDPYPYGDSLMYGWIDFYKGFRFCNILEQIVSDSAFTVVPNWRCNGTDDFCSKLGPFVSDKEIRATDGGFKDVKIFMQNVKCEQTTNRNVTSARVAAVIRAVHPSESIYSAARRSGISNMTVAAEGIWNSSSGQLCMVGCLGLVDDERSTCNHRVCLYIPLLFSIKQRSILLGGFSSINNTNASYFPLSFEKLVQPMELWNYFKTSSPHYSYSKIDSAGVILEKHESFSFRNVIKKSLLQFPKLEDTESFLTSLSLLSEDLTLQIPAVPDQFSNAQLLRTNMQMEILSVGPLFGRYWSNVSFIEGETPYHAKNEYTEKQLLLNVSAQLELSGKAYNNFSMLFLEGIYDPHVGKMYLVGCRDVRAAWNILFESRDLEAGLDCFIEVVVSYPPTTARWLINPRARISIASQRTEDDPLYFSTIKLESLPILYRRQREDILSRQGVEGILRILTLSLAISCILSQLFYIKNTTDYVPYISLVMLGVQALGYSLPLVTGAEALFKKMDSEPYGRSSYDLEKNQWLNVVDYTVKLLVMVAFLLTLRLCQKVWKSRIKLLNRAPLEPYRVPREKWVIITTTTIHFIGYITVIIIRSQKSNQMALRMDQFGNIADSSNKLQEWKTELEEYVGLVHDLFLLPQVIGNLIWQIDCKPLRKLYFMGITVVRLLPHVYDYIRKPTITNPYFYEKYEFVNPILDFYTKFGDISIPAMSVFLAILVYIQQRWNYEMLSQALVLGQFRLLPRGSRMYERLPSQSFESELVSGVNSNSTRDKSRDDEE